MQVVNNTVQAVKIAPHGLSGDLVVPERAEGIVLFAHGSGSGRHSPRNQYVAGVLQQGRLATLLLDLLTDAEEQIDLESGHLRFDIGFLASRLLEATDWLQQQRGVRNMSIGYFGASTGAGAALVAAAERPAPIKAIVSRGGRPDLAGSALPRVKAPTLLVVGSEDHHVVELNRAALAKLRCDKKLSIVPGATHLFEEPGTLEQVAMQARGWFQRNLKHEVQYGGT
jgi:putative phosphoribosyl transferase